MIKILVIEDEFPILEMINEFLNAEGYHVILASNGKDGLKKAFSLSPNIILCDINLPELNGYEVFEKLKSDQRTHTIPFVFISAKSDVKDMRKGMLQGANDYIPKPFTIDELLGVLKTQLEKQRKITGFFNEEIQKTKYYDEISGLGNRHLLEEHLKNNNKNISLLIISVNHSDNLKFILNDLELRELITEIVKRLKDSFKEEFKLYSIDNLKYACLLKSDDKNLILNLVKSLIRIIKKPLNLSNHTLHLNSNVGIATGNQDDSSSNLLLNAELALDQTQQYNNNYYIYNSKLGKNYIDNIKLKNALYSALKQNILQLYYQPKVSMATNKISGFEVLTRWFDPVYGYIPPTKFIPLAESSDFIVEFGDWLIIKIIHQLQQWKKENLNLKPLAVNISVNQFNNRDFCKNTLEKLKKADIIHLTEFELTENIFVNKTSHIKKVLTSFRSSGLKLALDDFGTGYSSLAYIKNFPFDKIKIDKTFIKDIPYDKNACQLTSGIIQMAKKMGYTVIAEGVETELQSSFLNKNNCDELQGYLFSKPLPASEIEKMIS